MTVRTRLSRKQLLTLALSIGLIFFPAVIAFAAIVLERPVSVGPGNRNLGTKFHPIQKKWKPHKGQDYPVPTGTVINMGPVQAMECKNDPDGYGSYAVVNYECNVQAIFAHLSSCDASSRKAISGNSGGSKGPHLHYEIKLGGAVVQPEDAIGKDLCDPEIRKQLIKEANDALNGLAGKDGETAPVNDGKGKTTYVPPSSSSGGGGSGGGGYYIIEDEDGRVTIVPENKGDSDVAELPEGEPAPIVGDTNTNNEVTGCATDTWTAMVNQAVLQTRRETLMNQRFIAKPDSVMAYACITDAFDNVRKDVGPIFSESKRWVNAEVDIIDTTVNVDKELGEYSLDGAMVNAALTPYETWMRSNFAHDYLGGTMEGSDSHSGDDGHSHTEDQAYANCGDMAMVWKMAKCNNVEGDPFFPKFEDLINNDPRKYPSRYACNLTGIKQEMIDTAKGKDVKFDKVDSYKEYLFPNAGECAPPIRTGVTTIYRKFEYDEAFKCPDPKGCEAPPAENRVSYETDMPDAVCITPGCHLKEGECVSK